MTVPVDEQMAEPSKTIKQKCVSCLKGSNLIKTVVIIVCTVVVGEQIAACIRKLIDVPVTTYTHFDFNKTILYPSVTFCREPPYKFDKMLEHGLYAHPRYTSMWINYNFSHPLDDLWDDITYTAEDFFVQYGLDGRTDNVEVHPTTGFLQGRCHTLTPKYPNSRATRSTGYSITLQHHAEDIATSTSTYPPGYHVYVHYRREPFTEVEVYNGGFVDYMYVNTGEILDVKLTVNEYNKLSRDDDPCITGSYSANKCTSTCVWNIVGNMAGCSGPWMKTDHPRCDNYTSMVSLISAYMNTYNNHQCSSCPRFCSSLFYNSFITDKQKQYLWDVTAHRWTVRTGDAELQSQLYMYFNSMMVSVYEERYNYDWNLFLSDLGGSVGFLLGLSVIGVMTIVTKTWSTIIRPFIKKPKYKIQRLSITGSTVTAKLEGHNIFKTDMFGKCYEKKSSIGIKNTINKEFM